MKTLALILILVGFHSAYAERYFVNFGRYGEVEFSEGRMGLWAHLNLQLPPLQRARLVFLPQCGALSFPNRYWQFRMSYEVSFSTDEVGLVKDSVQSYEMRLAEIRARELDSVALFVADGPQWVLLRCGRLVEDRDLVLPPSPLLP